MARLAIIIIASACARGQITDQPAPAKTQTTEADHPRDITLTIDGGTFIPDVTRNLHFDYIEGLRTTWK